MRLPIVCPSCGKQLGTVTDTTPRSGGTKVCPSCKERIHYEHDGKKVYVSRC